MRRRPTATLLTMALVMSSIELGAVTAFAQDPAADPLAEAKALNKEAEIKYQTAEYEAALALWKRAFAILPDTEDTRTIRNALVYNIAEAHSRAYEVSRNPTHLRKAKILLESYRENHTQLYGDEPAAVQERAQASDRIAQLEQMLADSEARGESATPLSDGAEPTQPAPSPNP
ncbi:hypothetical protein, partial [Enhygromyxa salina]|uniref:hypothetical protein n=1 Tax=Enhygromyxa salina TaxID=215803 RepID=UPI0011B28257